MDDEGFTRRPGLKFERKLTNFEGWMMKFKLGRKLFWWRFFRERNNR